MLQWCDFKFSLLYRTHPNWIRNSAGGGFLEVQIWAYCDSGWSQLGLRGGGRDRGWWRQRCIQDLEAVAMQQLQTSVTSFFRLVWKREFGFLIVGGDVILWRGFDVLCSSLYVRNVSGVGTRQCGVTIRVEVIEPMVSIKVVLFEVHSFTQWVLCRCCWSIDHFLFWVNSL